MTVELICRVVKDHIGVKFDKTFKTHNERIEMDRRFLPLRLVKLVLKCDLSTPLFRSNLLVFLFLRFGCSCAFLFVFLALFSFILSRGLRFLRLLCLFRRLNCFLRRFVLVVTCTHCFILVFENSVVVDPLVSLLFSLVLKFLRVDALPKLLAELLYNCLVAATSKS